MVKIVFTHQKIHNVIKQNDFEEFCTVGLVILYTTKLKWPDGATVAEW